MNNINPGWSVDLTKVYIHGQMETTEAIIPLCQVAGVYKDRFSNKSWVKVRMQDGRIAKGIYTITTEQRLLLHACAHLNNHLYFMSIPSKDIHHGS